MAMKLTRIPVGRNVSMAEMAAVEATNNRRAVRKPHRRHDSAQAEGAVMRTVFKLTKVAFHRSEKRACHVRWMGADGLVHLCRAHITESGECLCPCGASQRVAA